MTVRAFVSVVLVALLLAGGLSACGSTSATEPDALSAVGDAGLLEFELSLDAPPAVGPLEGEILVTRGGVPVTGADVWVTASMASHTHGVSDVRAEETGEGRYRVTGLEVTMAGEWQVALDALAAGAEDSTTFEVYVE